MTLVPNETEQALNRQYDVYAAARDEYREKIAEQAAEIERLRAALIPFACRCARKGEGAGGTCLAPGGICSWWNARAALEGK